MTLEELLSAAKQPFQISSAVAFAEIVIPVAVKVMDHGQSPGSINHPPGQVVWVVANGVPVDGTSGCDIGFQTEHIVSVNIKSVNIYQE